MTRALYDRIGLGYAVRRRPDERIASRIRIALRGCRRILNVGAGAGAYEPRDRFVVAIEPSAEMIKQRAVTAAHAIQGLAERLPCRDGSFDAALAILTIHHWSCREEGLAEMRRVAADRIVILTWDPDQPGFWLVRDYFPEILEIDRTTFPSLADVEKLIGPSEIHVVPVPADCSDGFLGAYWRRPAEYLNPDVRAAISTFSKIDSTEGLARLRGDLEDGSWFEKNGAVEPLQELDIGYRLIVARCA